jgi:hypothetical protein
MNSIKEKFEEKLYIDLNNRLSKVFYKCVKHEGHEQVKVRLNIELYYVVEELFLPVSRQLYWGRKAFFE